MIKVFRVSDQIIIDYYLTTLMVTHNMRDAIAHGNRLDAGRVILDIAGGQKTRLTVADQMQKLQLF